MLAQMVDLLDTLCPSQNLYLIDGYCLRKVVPKVHHYIKGLEAAVTSVELATKSMQVQVVENDGNQPQQMVKQCQFPVTAACTFTDYQLQG